MARRITALFLSVVWGVGPWTGATEPVQPRADPVHVRDGGDSVLVRRVHWPILVEPVRGGRDGAVDCTGLLPSHIEVLEDGETRPVTGLGPRPLPRLHVLLLDNSRSMRPRFGDAVEAAMRYLEALPPDDTVLLATFSDNLVLRVPPTRNREAVEEGLDGLGTGNMTALWDALYYLVRYVGPFPVEKIVVVITDGEDSVSLERHEPEHVLELARATPDLTIFPVGLDLRASTTSGFSRARHYLAEIARQTGGEFHEPETASHLAGVFQSVERRMERRLYVSYSPTPFGQGPRDGQGSAGFRWRKVSVRNRAGSPCRVRSVGSPRRLESRGRAAGLRSVPPDRADEIMAADAFSPCDTSVDPTAVVAKLELPPDTPWRDEAEPDAYLCPLIEGRGFIGWTNDIVLERGPLFLERVPRAGRSAKSKLVREAAFAQRAFRVAVPSLERLRVEVSRPTDVLRFLLAHEDCAPEPSDASPTARSPLFVHGQTFLELRELLGRALYATHGDYAAWAAEATAAEIDARIPQLLQSLPETVTLNAERRRALREAIVAHESDPREGAAHTRLVGWLGDVLASDAALELERETMNDLLEDPDGAARGRADRIVEAWSKLGRWFSPATQIRIVTPMIPAYDSHREWIGFYRFLLPAPTPSGTRSGVIPESPLGLSVLRWLIEDPEAGPVLRRGGLTVEALEYGRTGRGEARRLGYGFGRETGRDAVDRVTIGFRETSAVGESFRLVALFPSPEDRADEPAPPAGRVCLAVEGIGEDSPGTLGRALGAALGASWPRAVEP